MPDPTPLPESDPGTAGAAKAAAGALADKPAASPTVPGAPSSAIVLPPEPKYQWLAGLREITTTVIAAVILGVTVLMMWRTFKAAGNSFQDMKDVMLYALPILGTVMGYYFGRVPAERRAEASEQRAGDAQNTAQAATAQAVQTQNQTDQKLQKVKVAVERAKAKAEVTDAAGQSIGGVLSASGGASPGSSGSSGMVAELDSISKMI